MARRAIGIAEPLRLPLLFIYFYYFSLILFIYLFIYLLIFTFGGLEAGEIVQSGLEFDPRTHVKTLGPVAPIYDL